MLRSLSKLQATILGVVVLAGLAFAGIGIFAVGDQQLLWSDKLQVTTGFRQIRGLEVGTPVRVQGIKAGQVVAVEAPAEPGGDVIVHLRLSGRMRNLIRSDAAVQIVSEGMLGGKALEINPGTPSAQPIQEHAHLASRPTAELNDMLSQVKEAVTIPLAMKLSRFFNSIAHMSKRLVDEGASGLVFFNRSNRMPMRSRACLWWAGLCPKTPRLCWFVLIASETGAISQSRSCLSRAGPSSRRTAGAAWTNSRPGWRVSSTRGRKLSSSPMPTPEVTVRVSRGR